LASGFLLGALPQSGFGEGRERDAGANATVQRFQLLNGLRILHLHRQDGDRLVVNLLIRSGSTLEPAQKPGLARLSARRLLVQSADDTKELQVLGIELRVDVQPDATILRAGMPPRRLRTFLDLLGTALAPPPFEDRAAQAVAPVKEDPPGKSPDGLAHGRFRRAIFGDHPYGNGSGRMKGAEAIRYGDLVDFRRRHYIPNDASLIVVGPIPGRDLLDAAREKLGPWTKGVPQEPGYPEFPRLDRLSIQLVGGDEHGSEAGIVFGHRTPRRSSADFYSLEVLNLLLGGLGTGSRLSRVFLTHRINYRFLDSRIRFFRIGGMLQVLARVPTQAAASALTAILEAVESLKQTPVSEAELESAKTRLIASHEEKMRSPEAVAHELTQMELFSLSKDFLHRFGDHVRRLTPEDIQGAAKAHLSTTRAVAVVTGSNPTARTGWDRFGTAEVVALPVRSE
jgi:zinc protease